MKKAKQIAAIVLAVLGIVIILQNTAPVETELVFVTVTMPRAVLLFFAILVGFALGILVCMSFSKKGKKT